MKKYIYTLLACYAFTGIAQEDDTTRVNLGGMEVLVIDKKKDANDTIDAAPDHDPDEDEHKLIGEGHWGGIDFGPTILMNSAMKTQFPDQPQWQNDPGKSFYWNINIFDTRLNVYKEYVGITTGFGINFTQIGIKNNEILMESPDSLWFVKDSVNVYSKNKLRGTYLQVPLLIEFNTNKKESKSFYLATGVIGGVRVGSALIQKVDNNGSRKKEKYKGTYGLQAFKADATVRMGYSRWGLFANYALIPLFDTNLTSEAYPLTFGLTYNF
ncbi:MAG: hypothetical protein EP338_09200 [Bacteroidetes bacterium]|nr:MAG: hypothetical protein EP338_09200 [Bacteroidota bacterium]